MPLEFPSTSIHILYIEDNPADVDLLTHNLDECREFYIPRVQKVVINHAESLELATNKIRDRNYDIVLLDLNLPDSHGLETFHNIRPKLTANTPLIIVTGQSDIALAREAIASGAEDVIIKDAGDGHMLWRALIYARERRHLSNELNNKQKQLQLANERFELAMEASSEGIWEWNIDSGEVHFSSRFKLILGFEPQELPNKFHTWIQLIHTDDLGKFLMIWGEFMQGKRKDFIVEYRMRCKNDEYIWVQTRGTSRLGQSGKVRRMLGTNVDITERKAHEIAMELHRKRLEAVIAEQVKLRNENQELEMLAVTDALTCIYNRRHFDQILDIEWRRAIREQAMIAILMIDVDLFKQYNDTFGHQQGDHCLQKIASALSNSVRRPADLVARYGGEEFVILMPNTDLAGARVIAQTCHSEVAALRMPNSKADTESFVTISIGIATLFASKKLQTNDLIALADNALYQAKKAGRNRTVSANPFLNSEKTSAKNQTNNENVILKFKQ